MTVLPNGLRVLSLDQGGPLSSLGLFIQAGSRHERCGSLGSSHYLARPATYTTFNRSSVRLTNDLENVHAFQVSRGREYTSFSCQVLRDEVPSTASLLLDMARPRALEYEIRDVSEAVAADSAAALSTPSLLLEDEAHNTAFRAAGLGRSLYSRSSTNLQQEQIVRYLFNNWRPEFSTLVGVNVPHAQLVEAAKAPENFKDHVEGLATPRTPGNPIAYRGGESRKYTVDPLQFALGFRGLSHAEGGKDIQPVVVHLLQKRLGDHWKGSSFTYTDAGLVVFSSFSPSASATSTIIKTAAESMKNGPFSEAEVEGAKRAVRAQCGVCAQSSPAALLKSLVCGGGNVAAVTADQANKFAIAIVSSPVTLVSVGNSGHLPPTYMIEEILHN